MANKPDIPQEKIRKLQGQVSDYERLNKILEKVNTEVQVEAILEQIIEESLKLCNADEASIMLTYEKKELSALTLLKQRQASVAKLDHRINTLLTGWVTRYKKPLLSNDLVNTFSERAITAKYRSICSALSVPLFLDGKITGVINLISENENHFFTSREQHLMSVLASQCALLIRNARLHDDLFAETLRLKKEIQNKYERQGIIGHSPKMKAVFSLIDSIIPTDVRVLIEGESGTGKERIARAIHYSGPQKGAPFVAVDCGALPANLLESELFGYVRGAFTGASQDREGLFEEAHGGTLFLDEISNMPSEVQVKFLRAIQEGEIRPLGTNQVKKVDVRILAATSKKLEEEVVVGNFRQDLFYRLNVVNFVLPPLRERREDIAILADHFLKQLSEKYGKQIRSFDAKTISALESYGWPGNIRELENAIERAVVLCKTDELRDSDFTFFSATAPGSKSIPTEFHPQPLEEALFEMKRDYVRKVLDHASGVKKRAAELMQIQPTYLSRLLKNLRIED